jgi:hypothetical protein
MTANDSTPGTGQEGTDTDYYAALREATADLAAIRWDGQGMDIHNLDEWGPLSDRTFIVGDVETGNLDVAAAGKHGRVRVGRGELGEGCLSLTYTEDHVFVSLGSTASPSDPSGSASTRMTPSQARQAAALFAQAAEELERRRAVQAEGGGKEGRANGD